MIPVSPELFVGKASSRHGDYVNGQTNSANPSITHYLYDYKYRKVLKKFKEMSIHDVDKMFPPTHEYIIGQKYDGECSALYYDKDNGTLMHNSPNDTARYGFPASDEFENVMVSAGYERAVIFAEAYVVGDWPHPTKRISDFKSAAAQGKSESLRLAVFGISTLCQDHKSGLVECDNCVSYLTQEGKEVEYQEVMEKVDHLFKESQYIHPIRYQVGGISKIQSLYEEWVDAHDTEGLVIRHLQTQRQGFKIKPQRFVDAVIIGFERGESGGVRGGKQERLGKAVIAVMDGDTDLRVLGKVGGGFTYGQNPDTSLNIIGDALERSVCVGSYDDKGVWQGRIGDIGWESRPSDIQDDENIFRPAVKIPGVDIGNMYFVEPKIVIQVKYQKLLKSEDVLESKPTLRWTGDEYTVSVSKPIGRMLSPRLDTVRHDKSFNHLDIRAAQILEIDSDTLPSQQKPTIFKPKSALVENYKVRAGKKWDQVEVVYTGPDMRGFYTYTIKNNGRNLFSGIKNGLDRAKDGAKGHLRKEYKQIKLIDSKESI